MLISMIKEFSFFQNFAALVSSLIPAVVEHNLAKYAALRKAFYLTGLEVSGDYLEFGVFTGASLVSASKIYRRMRTDGREKVRFFGFDSFDGFGALDRNEEHHFFTDSTFKVDFKKVVRNIKKQTRGCEVELVKGFFEHTLRGRRPQERGISQARVILMDCDMTEASSLALNYVKSLLQLGTILVMDDFYAFKGSRTRGVAGAFKKFQIESPEFQFRRVFDYGYGGAVFIVSEVQSVRIDSARQPMPRSGSLIGNREFLEV